MRSDCRESSGDLQLKSHADILHAFGSILRRHSCLLQSNLDASRPGAPHPRGGASHLHPPRGTQEDPRTLPILARRVDSIVGGSTRDFLSGALDVVGNLVASFHAFPPVSSTSGNVCAVAPHPLTGGTVAGWLGCRAQDELAPLLMSCVNVPTGCDDASRAKHVAWQDRVLRRASPAMRGPNA